MSKEDKKTKSRSGRVVTDPRFAAVNHDPRFRKFAAHQGKVQVDERFAGMFQDAAFTMPSRTDKRGGRGPGRKAAEDLKRYYRLADAQREEEAMAAGEEVSVRVRNAGVGEADEKAGEEAGEEPPQASEGVGVEGAQDENASSFPEDEEERERRARWSRLRGIGAEEESSSEEEEEAGVQKIADSDAEDASLQAEWGVGAMAVNPRERIPGTEQATARLAAVDLDWDHVRAVDILAVLRSFAGGNHGIRRVTVYPSDYGLERLAEEAVMGPPTSIYRSTGEEDESGSKKVSDGEERSGSEEGSGSEDENDVEFGSDGEAGGGEEEAAGSGEEEASESGEEEAAGSGEEEAEIGEDSEGDKPASLPPPNSFSANHKGISRSGDGEVDDERLRVYERSRLRYYYAVVECASAEVASKIYDECDGMEFLLSACKFDLRFVPEEQSFKGRQVRDAAAGVPPDYVPPFFEARALQLTNVGLSWDGDDKGRRKILTRKMTAEDIKEDDLRAYLASSSDSEAEVDQAVAPSANNGRAGRNKAQERDLYRSLLVGGGDSRGGRKDWGKARSEEDSEDEPEEEAPPQRNKDVEMVVTFGGGLDQLGQRLLEKKSRRQSKQEETVWDAYLQRRREKRAAAKKLGRHNIYSDDESDGDGRFGGSGSEDDAPHGTKDDPFFQHDADPFADPFFADGTAEAGQKAAAKKRTGGKEGGKAGRVGKDGKGPKAPSRDADELDLLALKDDAILSGRGGPAPQARSGDEEDQAGKRLSRKERIKAKKALKRREREYGSDDEGELGGQRPAKPLEDSRFADLVDSSAFALDPTDPRYDTRTAALASEITARKVKRGKGRQEPSSKPGEDMELRMMVAAVKRKSAAKRE